MITSVSERQKRTRKELEWFSIENHEKDAIFGSHPLVFSRCAKRTGTLSRIKWCWARLPRMKDHRCVRERRRCERRKFGAFRARSAKKSRNFRLNFSICVIENPAPACARTRSKLLEVPTCSKSHVLWKERQIAWFGSFSYTQIGRRRCYFKVLQNDVRTNACVFARFPPK